MKDKEKQTKVFDILDKMEFFQGQRAGRELWNDKPKEVQDKDISDFIKDINYIRSYLQDSVVFSKEELKEKYVPKSFYELAKKVHEEKVEKLENLINYWIENWKQASTETAEKFLQLAYDRCLEKSFIKKVEELAKQFGVEIKE